MMAPAVVTRARERLLLVEADAATPARAHPSLTLNDIRREAYRRWEAAGKPSGDCSRFWLEAEQELLQAQ